MTTTEATSLDRYFEALARCDPAAATDVVLELLEAGASVGEIARDVVVPAQARVGELWASGEWSVAQEHTATAVTEAAVSALWVMTARRQLRAGPRVAVASAEGEWHALPSRLAAVLAAEAGADVTVLGPSMPAEQLRRRLADGDVDVLAVSCTVPANLVGAARCVAVAHDVGIPAVVGGRAFAGRTSRAAAIGAAALLVDPQDLCEQVPSTVGQGVELPPEVVRLDAAASGAGDLLARVVAAYPVVGRLPQSEQERFREDVVWLLRSTAASVLTDDPTIVDDGLRYAVRDRRESLGDDVVLGSADVVADGVEHVAPGGAAVLRDAVRRARGA